MSEQTIAAGDVITATVTKAVPFGVLVECAGVSGLVRGTAADPGVELRVRVVEYDAVQQRFSATRE